MTRVAKSKLSKQMTLRQFDHGYWMDTPKNYRAFWSRPERDSK